MSETLPHINGLILAGGESSRMGSDKSLLTYHGIPQRDHLHQMLGGFCQKVFLSCKSVTGIPSYLNALPDRYDIKGPLNGILSALTQDSRCAWLTVPVDMPHIDAKIITFLLEKRDTEKTATCFCDSDGKEPEPLFAIWEPKAFPLLKEYFSKGRTSPRDFLKTHDVKVIQSPTPLVHVNVNSKDDLRNFYERKDHSS
jgi:molybdenum cofactor guanylyltransferase